MADDVVEIVEVSPRDGLQNEPAPIPTDRKVALVEALQEVGFTRIEAASFVSPRWVPQMADGEEVLARVRRRPGVRLIALTPNVRGFERAQAAGADEVAVFAAATESFSKANLNCRREECLERIAPVVRAARDAGLPVRGYVSVVTDCPYEGVVSPPAVAEMAEALAALGCGEISLGETLGRGTPERVDAMLGAILARLPPDRLAAHFHDTAGRAIANVDVALERGLRILDASIAGLGGCPFAPGAAGNVATEKLAAHLAASGYRTGLDAGALDRAAALARRLKEA